ncbi:hypothetical protein DPMN_148824 [Dreissena polymorpha]|uniref:Uncharacterized protein n=1 Tax=Dreissena polymorpha TaxID=45954 RepID=A0A9D4J1X3_DREPO|nr:hypothetical protein DPMN_148824 [Dreissena polymorpha]
MSCFPSLFGKKVVTRARTAWTRKMTGSAGLFGEFMDVFHRDFASILSVARGIQTFRSSVFTTCQLRQRSKFILCYVVKIEKYKWEKVGF